MPQARKAQLDGITTGRRAQPAAVLATIGCVALVGPDLRPAIVSVGPLLVPVAAEFGLTHAAAARLTATPDVLMGVLAALAPGLARRFGWDRVVLAALALLMMATGGKVFARSTAVLFLATAGVGTGIAIAGGLIGGFVKAAFPQRVALLMEVHTAALSLGSTLAAGLTGPVAAWRDSWRVGAGLWTVLGLTVVAAWLVVERRHGGDAAVSPHRHRLPFDSGKAWLIALFFAAQNFLFYSLILWLVPLYRERGLPATTAGLILASFTGSFFVANMVSGAVSRRKTAAGFALLALLGLVLLAAVSTATPFAVVPVVAFGLGGCFTLGITLALDSTDGADQANSWGAFITLVASTGPFTVGALRDASHGFAGSLWLLTVAGAAMLGLTPLLRPGRDKCGKA